MSCSEDPAKSAITPSNDPAFEDSKLFERLQKAIFNRVEELNKGQHCQYDPKIAIQFFSDQYPRMSMFLEEYRARNLDEENFNELAPEVFNRIYEYSTVSTACSDSDVLLAVPPRPAPTAVPNIATPKPDFSYPSNGETRFNFTEEAAEKLLQEAKEHMPADLLMR